MARPPKPAQPWTRVSLEHVVHDPYPIVREQLRAHNDLEVTYMYIPGGSPFSLLPRTEACCWCTSTAMCGEGIL